jgi:hypothetical protein
LLLLMVVVVPCRQPHPPAVLGPAWTQSTPSCWLSRPGGRYRFIWLCSVFRGAQRAEKAETQSERSNRSTVTDDLENAGRSLTRAISLSGQKMKIDGVQRPCPALLACHCAANLCAWMILSPNSLSSHSLDPHLTPATAVSWVFLRCPSIHLLNCLHQPSSSASVAATTSPGCQQRLEQRAAASCPPRKEGMRPQGCLSLACRYVMLLCTDFLATHAPAAASCMGITFNDYAGLGQVPAGAPAPGCCNSSMAGAAAAEQGPVPLPLCSSRAAATTCVPTNTDANRRHRAAQVPTGLHHQV